MREMHEPSQTMDPLYEAIVWHIPAPRKSTQTISSSSSRISTTAITSAGSLTAASSAAA